jgi:arylsulfatase
MLRTCTALAVLALACGDGRPEPPAGPATPSLLLLLTVDTLRADALGAYAGEPSLTPQLDALARESLVFEAAYAPTPFTLPSLASLHTGRYPIELGLKSNLSLLPEGTPTIASALRERGWKTAGVVSNVVLRGRRDLALGFEAYDDKMDQQESTRLWPERIAADTTDAALRLLESWQVDPEARAHPLFLWVHYQDPHGPYTPPPGWRERFRDRASARHGSLELAKDPTSLGEGGSPAYQMIDDRREASFYQAGYDAEVAYMDAELGRLLDGVRKRGLYDDTLLVFAADHGEAMGEHDYWFAHGHHVTDELVRIPLLIKLPGQSASRRGDVASLVDLRPTLLSAALGEPWPDPGQGRDLLRPDADRTDSVPLLSTLFAYRLQRHGIVSEGYKLILTYEDDIWSSRLHRLGNEDVDLAAPAPQVASRLREQLRELRDQLDARVPEQARSLSEQERRELQALGYLQETSP